MLFVHVAENCYRRVKACLEKGTHSPSTIHDIFRSVRKVRNAQVKEELLEDWTEYFKEDAYALTCCRLVETAAFLRKGEMDSARLCLKEAQAGLSARTPELSLAFYKMQGRYYFRCGEYEQAARTYRRHLHLSDSLQRSLVSDRLERITAGYNQARLEQQIRLLQCCPTNPMQPARQATDRHKIPAGQRIGNLPAAHVPFHFGCPATAIFPENIREHFGTHPQRRVELGEILQTGKQPVRRLPPKTGSTPRAFLREGRAVSVPAARRIPPGRNRLRHESNRLCRTQKEHRPAEAVRS